MGQGRLEAGPSYLLASVNNQRVQGGEQSHVLCSISVPSTASRNLLVTAGNMARDHQMQISFLGMHAAAAGLALSERRWFHISRASASASRYRLIYAGGAAAQRLSATTIELAILSRSPLSAVLRTGCNGLSRKAECVS